MARRRFQPANFGSTSGSADASSSILTVDYSWEGTRRERQSLHFFSVISAPELSGLLDTQFWQRLVLQAAQSEDAIKHTVAAIGASHELQLRRQASRNNAETDGLQPFALRQCNKAIEDLIRPAENVSQCDIMRALTASVLFACFESLSVNRTGAIQHIVYSRRLLDQYKRNQDRCHHDVRSEAFPIHLDFIEPLVAHYEVQIDDFMYDNVAEGESNTPKLRDLLQFNRIADARVSLERAIASLVVVCSSLERNHTPNNIVAVDKVRAGYSTWLERWDREFSAFLARERQTLGKEGVDGCRLLKAHQIATSTLANVNYGKGEGVWSAFAPKFTVILELIAAILEDSPKRGVSSRPPQTQYFSTSMGMTEPLYCTASRCTDPVVAERARSLLMQLPLSEGVHSEWRISFIESTLCTVTGKYHNSSKADT